MSEIPTVTGVIWPDIHLSRSGSADCVSGIVSVTTATTKNLELHLPSPLNQSQVTQIILDFATSGSTYIQSISTGTQNVTGTYEIGATLCVPINRTSNHLVQFLTHGLGFDRSYWDFASGYSYVDAALTNGHAVFLYDRLGVGLSSKPDPVNLVQAGLQLEIANALICKLRAGELENTTFSTVVGVGHSFGSVLTQAVTSTYPRSLDAAILTGYSLNSTGFPLFLTGVNLAIASEARPYQFSGSQNGYTVASTAISNQIGFFHAPGFDPAIVSLADSTKGTIAVGELLSTSAIVGPALEFNGTVAIVNGIDDLPFCNGNCSSPGNLLGQVKQLYPRVSNDSFVTSLVPNTGHAISLHYSAGAVYESVQALLIAKGL
ncbi:hypothetical protein M409DRAFT_65522 [Zasmidium cellare ATCC 36951]|uniref:AB hydrolase-1 domain-containing protein n=1 Tax=Zasmidium cellare ATCC 36951 TaxID=1080233 RepID=A0A6A6CNC5_ZASCE|nr:uncharacterized protein M409DRAFT_65522 [Zasmidium cellare ATCC 36951]KAF2168635.1 hypothetical protein M409DRAFT_65522 [Zasmidium cellare ATCC 36951]